MFSLSLELGFPHPRYLQQCLTSQDITDWIAYAERRPFGQWRQEMHAGTIAAALYNVQRAKSSDPVLNWEDFFPNTITLEKQQDAAAAKEDLAKQDRAFVALVQAWAKGREAAKHKGK